MPDFQSRHLIHSRGDTPPTDGMVYFRQHQSDVPPKDFGGAIRRRWRLVAGCIVLAGGTAIGVTSFLPRIYEASTTIRIDEHQGGVLPLDVMERSSRGSDFSTEMEALRSRTLAETVIDSLGLRLTITKPRFAPPSTFISNVSVDANATTGSYRLLRQRGGHFQLDSGATHTPLAGAVLNQLVSAGGVSFRLAPRAEKEATIHFTVSPLPDVLDDVRRELTIDRTVRDANMVTVAYRSVDPEMARNVPNAIATQFITRRQSVRQREARSTVTFLREQIDRISTQLASAENSLRAYRVGQRVVDPQEEGRTQLTRMADVEAQLGMLDAERSSLAQLLQEVDSASRNRGAGDSPYRNLVAFPSLLRNQATAQLLASLSAVEDRRADLLTRRSVQDPDVKQLSDRVEELEKQLWSLTTTYLKGLTNQTSALRGSLEQSSRQLGLLPAREVEFARLDRETKLLASLYTMLQTRLKEAEIAAASGDASVQLVDMAALPRRPISPKPALNAALGMLVGLLLGVAAAAMREHVDHSVRSREDLGAVTGVQVVGLIPHLRRSRNWLRRPIGSRADARLGSVQKKRAVSAGELRTPAASVLLPSAMIEAYNRLEANIGFTRRTSTNGTLVVTSPLPGEGKTSVATNLALVSAQRGARVLLIDADLRCGVLDTLFECPRSPGFADVLDETASLSDAVWSVDVGGGNTLNFLTTGTLPPNPAQLLSSPRLRALIEKASSEFDVIIFDTPPMNVVADAALLAILCETVLVVARSGVTTLDALMLAMEQIRHVRVPQVCAVLNDITLARDGAYGGEYDYYAAASSHVANKQQSELSPT